MHPYTHEELRKETTAEVAAEITSVTGKFNRNGTITFRAFPALRLADGGIFSVNSKNAKEETTSDVIEEDAEAAYFKNIFGETTAVDIY